MGDWRLGTSSQNQEPPFFSRVLAPLPRLRVATEAIDAKALSLILRRMGAGKEEGI